ncbi:uncharacterized protein PHALS_15454 [Plasmopara halstedii]|uniref:Uncharacterized protein n=1 Tax=Plasmopara halstedii TaxID=4781 RepID=A0A0P1AIZ8_PLAHL|nr:uncharacterized protein PHALS_15454 [Plasmopara halstedii]CEG40497.1 hypothetical protein PHALS_15454 [Plasmopara halstedii]|eukprot:XP_024576866.1 hypothetical protein PHALS_15454 [Plasmopara halstedii]
MQHRYVLQPTVPHICEVLAFVHLTIFQQVTVAVSVTDCIASATANKCTFLIIRILAVAR